MSRYRIAVVSSLGLAVIALAVIAACSQPFFGSFQDPGAANIGSPLPADRISDVPRAAAREFTFETVLPVALQLRVEFYEVDQSGRVVGDQLPAGTADVFVTLEDSSGAPIYAGKVGTGGTLSGVIQLPAAPETVTMRLTASGFEDRGVVIPDMVELSAVDRVMAMARVVSGDGTYLARDLTGLEDSDGDGVPDAYDAFPKDPDSAFKLNVPAEGKLTIAFEDLFRRANAGDADYNDFVAAYAIEEALTTEGYVNSIKVTADAVAKIAGYDHRFGIRIDNFDGEADLTGTYIDAAGNSQTLNPLGLKVSAPAEIILFENSDEAVGLSATFTLKFADPQRRPGTGPPAPVAEDEELPPESPLPQAPYNPFVIVINTERDIHLIGREPLLNSTNKVDNDGNPETFRDADGFPWALLVPDDWEHPAETQRIEIPYPRFTLWRESGGEKHSDWYLHDDLPPPAEPVVYVAGYYNGGSGDVAAYWMDSVRTDLPVPTGSTGARANDIFVNGDTVYVAGWYADPGTRNQVAAYWVNTGTAVALTSPGEIGEATGIAVENSTVYISGKTASADFSSETALVWVVGNAPTLLYSGEPFAAATEILVRDGVAYVSGYYNTGTVTRGVSYWAGSTGVDLSGGIISQGWDIDVSPAGEVYVAGNVLSGSNYASAYWTDTDSGIVSTTLYVDTVTVGNWSRVTGIDEVDGTVYAAGYYETDTNQFAAYWVHTPPAGPSAPINLSSGSRNDRATDVTVSGGTVYVVGTVRPSDRLVAMLWTDGDAVVLHDSGVAGFNAEALSVLVVQP